MPDIQIDVASRSCLIAARSRSPTPGSRSVARPGNSRRPARRRRRHPRGLEGHRRRRRAGRRQVIDCRGKTRGARPHRHARLHRRAERATIARPSPPPARRRRPAASPPSSASPTPRRRSTTRRRSNSCCAARATPPSCRASDGGDHQGPRRRGDDRDRPLEGGRRGRLHRRRQKRDQRAGRCGARSPMPAISMRWSCITPRTPNWSATA